MHSSSIAMSHPPPSPRLVCIQLQQIIPLFRNVNAVSKGPVSGLGIHVPPYRTFRVVRFSAGRLLSQGELDPFVVRVADWRSQRYHFSR